MTEQPNTPPAVEPPDYGARTPARRDEQGRYLDPDSGKPVDYFVEELGAGREMTEADLRWFRSRDMVPTLPQEPQRDDTADTWHREEQERLAELERQAREAADGLGHASNVDTAGRPHFARLVGDVSTCGQDGEPWPCSTWTEMAQQVGKEAAGEVVITDEQLRRMAEKLGVSPLQVRAALLEDAL